jgi:hypothetical protein
MYTRTQITHTVADDSSLKQPSPKFEKTRTSETMSQSVARRVSIPGSTTDKSIPLDGLVGKALFLSCDRQLSVKLNGSADALLLGAVAEEGGELALSNSNITSLEVTNAGTEAVELRFSMAG